MFRPATPADIDTLLALHREFFAGEGYPHDDDGARAAIVMLIADPFLGRFYVAEEGGTLIGYFILGYGFSVECHGRDAFLDELYIAPDARRRGVGKEAIALAESVCRADGIRALHLEVEHGKPDTYRLYRERGFKDHERHLMTKRFD